MPSGVSPQLGPDATGVGWIYEYVLVTGRYCPEHPDGLWHDPESDRWYDDVGAAALDAHAREALVHQRVFQEPHTVWVDRAGNRRYESLEAVPDEERGRVEPLVLGRAYDRCPLDGHQLVASDLDLSDLRGLQDWYLRYELTSVEGVSEVASAGGFVKQYQVVVDPVKLLAYALPIQAVKQALQRSNLDVGGRLVEMSETEYMVRGVGFLGSLTDAEIADAKLGGRRVEEVRSARVLDELAQVALGVDKNGSPIYLADVADVRIGPEIRRGVIEWNGRGEAVGGIVVMRFAQNARETIRRVGARLDELEHGLPPGVGIEVGYDRSDLIDRAVHTLTGTLVEEITVVALVCILFLLHARSELVAVFVVPMGVLASILIMHLFDINANIMSLGGIAIAIGVMVDSSIVMVENAHKHLDREEERLHRAAETGRAAVPRPRTEIIAEAAREVGPSLFFSLLIITVSFVPVFALGEQSGRLFKPLAYTKTFAMASAAFLAVTVIPVLMTFFITARVLPSRWGWRRNLAITLSAMLMPAALVVVSPLPLDESTKLWIAVGWMVFSAMLLVPQRIIHEQANPISRVLQRLYHPLFVMTMRFRVLVLVGAVALVASTLWPLGQLGSEFMPPLEEGDLLYMPTTDPG
ncbi:MAG: efflux RND transporter permease subunit, partial [Myxococcales bacterium]|nr:efflux RND transporter permease subunit [Myxococcales bacterium]